MKKIFFPVFLLAAGIAFSQTGSQPEDLSTPEIPPQELSEREPDSGELSQGESDSEELPQLEADTEALVQGDKEKLLTEENSSGLPSSEDLGVPSASDRAKAAATKTETGPREFPQWAKDLRRGEIIAFGAYPIAIFFSRIFLDLYRMSQNNWDRRYAPWPATAAGGPGLTENELKALFGIAAVVSVTVSVADHLIVKHKRSKAAKAAKQ